MAAADMGSGKAPGTDGWYAEELKLLPRAFYAALAEVLNGVELSGEWPEALLSATVSMIPKEEDPDPLGPSPYYGHVGDIQGVGESQGKPTDGLAGGVGD